MSLLERMPLCQVLSARLMGLMVGQKLRNDYDPGFSKRCGRLGDRPWLPGFGSFCPLGWNS